LTLGRELRVVLTAAIIFFILLSPLLYVLFIPEKEEGIDVDGRFGEWSGLGGGIDALGEGEGVDLIEYKVREKNEMIGLYIKTEEGLFSSSSPGGLSDGIYIFIDSGNDYNTETKTYNIGHFHADHLISVFGEEGEIKQSTLFVYDGNGVTNDWLNWEPIAKIEADSRDNEVECSFFTSDIASSDPSFLIMVKDRDGFVDVGDGYLTLSGNHLLIAETTLASPVENGQFVLEKIEITATGDLELTQLNFARHGPFSSVELFLDENGNGVFDDDDIEVGTGDVDTSSDLQIEVDEDHQEFRDGDQKRYFILVDTREGFPFRGNGELEDSGVLDIHLDPVTPAELTTGRVFLEQNIKKILVNVDATDTIEIDGAFGDWWDIGRHQWKSGVGWDPMGDVPGPNAGGVDLVGYGTIQDDEYLSLMMRTKGPMMGGTVIPVPNPSFEERNDTGEKEEKEEDSDKDGIPNSEDDFPYDHDNDGVSDDHDEDDDNDGFPDSRDRYPLDRDNDGTPGDQSDTGGGGVQPGHRELVAKDLAFIFLDTDGLSITGFRLLDVNIGADVRIQIEGHNGEILSAVYETWNSFLMKWERQGELSAANDNTALETQIALDELGLSLLNKEILVYFFMVNWGGNSDDTDLHISTGDLRRFSELDNPGTRSFSESPTVNGLFYGDGDVNKYNLLSTALGGRGSVYFRLDGDTLYLAVLVNSSVNDNVFGSNKLDRSYLDSANWNNHNGKHLLNSDNVELRLTDGGTNDYQWEQDYCYDADGDRDPSEADWLSDPYGADGGGTPPPGLTASASSLQYNLNNSTWDVTLGGTRNKPDSWKSLDEDGDGDVTDEGWPAFNSTFDWEWSLVYEMSIDVSGWNTASITVEVVSAHNSPAKDGDPDVPVPPTKIPVELVINEIMFDPWVEIYNPSSSTISLDGYYISNRNLTDEKVALPDWDMPADSYLVVNMGEGTNESDFSDNDGDGYLEAYYYAGIQDGFFNLSDNYFGFDGDEVALFYMVDSDITMIDFVAYHRGSSGYTSGDAHDEAVDDDIWDSGDFFDSSNVSFIANESIGRDMESTDTNQPADWWDRGGIDSTNMTQGFINNYQYWYYENYNETVNDHLVINEVLIDPTGDDENGGEWVEVYNPTNSTINLSSHYISDRYLTHRIALPAWEMPADSYIIVYLGGGTNDSNFSDNDGDGYLEACYYAWLSEDFFDNDMDEVALFTEESGDGGFEGDSDSDNGYVFTLENMTNNGDGTTTVTVRVKNDNNKGLSHVAISLPEGVVPSEPDDGDIYVGENASYHVENPAGTPFYSIKFETIGEGPKNGASDSFEYVIPTEDAENMSSITVLAKAADIIGTVTLNVSYGGSGTETQMIDFVAYNDGPSGFTPGEAHDEAVDDGIWDDGDFFDVTDVSVNETFGRDKWSTDTDQPDDWCDHGGKDADGWTLGFQNTMEKIPEFSELLPPVVIVFGVFLYYRRRRKLGKAQENRE